MGAEFRHKRLDPFGVTLKGHLIPELSPLGLAKAFAYTVSLSFAPSAPSCLDSKMLFVKAPTPTSYCISISILESASR